MGKLRWYKRDPDAALAGMAELTLVERGAYNSVLDLLYSRDGIVADDDVLVARMIGCHWREWRAVKSRLLQRGKIRIEDGHLTANRVQETLKEAASFSQDQSRRASSGWHKRKKLNKINDPLMPSGNAYTTTTTTTKKDNSIKGANAPDPQKYLYERGKEVLGRSAGGQISKLLRAFNGNVGETLGIIEIAAEKENPNEYISATIKGAKNGNGSSHQNRKPSGVDFLASMAGVKSGRGNQTECLSEPHRGPEIDLTGAGLVQAPDSDFNGLLGLPRGK